jgi:hypothetical protein
VEPLRVEALRVVLPVLGVVICFSMEKKGDRKWLLLNA